MLAGELFDEVGYTLNDMEPGHQHVRWVESELALYLTDAIAQLAALKPTLFQAYVTIPLRKGASQRIDPQYVELIDIVYNIYPDGQIGPNVRPGEYGLQRAFGVPLQADTPIQPYVLRTWSVHPEADSLWFADPPVTYDVPTSKVMALVQMAPQKISKRDSTIFFPNTVADVYRSALIDWILYRCFAKDTESQASLDRSQTYYKAFYALVGTPPRDRNATPLGGTPSGKAAA